jgi:hypothetical protein
MKYIFYILPVLAGLALTLTLFTKVLSTVIIILIGSVGGFLLLNI